MRVRSRSKEQQYQIVPRPALLIISPLFHQSKTSLYTVSSPTVRVCVPPILPPPRFCPDTTRSRSTAQISEGRLAHASVGNKEPWLVVKISAGFVCCGRQKLTPISSAPAPSSIKTRCIKQMGTHPGIIESSVYVRNYRSTS